MPNPLAAYPAPEYVEAIKARAWSLLETPLGLKTCQQVASEDGPFPDDSPFEDDYPFLGIISNGWEGDRAEGGLPALNGTLSFSLVYLKQFALPTDDEDPINEHDLWKALDADLRTISQVFALDDFSLPGFSPPAGYRHRRIYPVGIRPAIDTERADISTRLIGGVVELRAIGDSFRVPDP